MLRLTLLLLLSLSATALPSTALAQCGTGHANESEGGGTVFGLRWDGVRLAAGQSIDLTCSTQIHSVGFLVKSQSGSHGLGVEYLHTGDPVVVEIIDADLNVLAAGTATVMHDAGMGWVTADLSGTPVLEPGQYLVTARVEVDKLSTMGTTDDAIPGARWAYNYQSDWGFAWDGDLNMSIVWEEVQVSNEVSSWSGVKGMYR